MKASVLQIGILSVLLTATLPSEGRSNNKPGGGTVGRAVKGMNSRGGQAVSGEARRNVENANRESNRESRGAVPTPPNSSPAENLQVRNSANAVLRITSGEARSIVDALAAKVEIKNDAKRMIMEVLTENAQIGQSAKLLAEKLRDPTTSEEIKTEDLQTIVEYLKQVKDMEYVARNEENPANENILMDLATNAMEMATWRQNPRDNATGLLREIAEAAKRQPSITDALDVALENRGYTTPEARARRKRQIRENCRK